MPGQTLSELRALLAAAGLVPRHRYGQHFLIDLNLMRKLVAAAELRPADVVLEVGCGTGSLTELLLAAEVRVIGVEIDRGLQGILAERLGSQPGFVLVRGDALAGKHELGAPLRQALSTYVPAGDGRYKLVANLPYQIATPLLMELLYASPRFERLTCTVQKEVGDRLRAPVHTDAYGPVAVIAQTLAEVELVARLPPAAFWPRPQVDSVMLTLRLRPPAQVELDDVAGFARFVQRAFAHRRKTLRRIAAGWPVPDLAAAFAQAGISSDVRPETLSPARWQNLYRAVRARSAP